MSPTHRDLGIWPDFPSALVREGVIFLKAIFSFNLEHQFFTCNVHVKLVILKKIGRMCVLDFVLLLGQLLNSVSFSFQFSSSASFSASNLFLELPWSWEPCSSTAINRPSPTPRSRTKRFKKWGPVYKSC